MRTTTVAKLLAGAAATASLVALGAGPVLADPPSGTTPAATDLVGVGSDTVQALFNQFSTDYTATPKLYSYDATGSASITTKTGATSITRPNGSGAGITALQNTTDTTVDFARSSRALQPTDPSNDWFIAYAKDAVSWAAQSGGHAPNNLTTADLAGIYKCTITNWDQITDVSGYTGPNATIQAFLPQSGSGTRAFFETAIGITDAQVGGCVNQTVEENEGTNTLLQTNDSIVPYSVGHYIGQVYYSHTTLTDAPGPLTVRSTNGVAPIDTTNKVIASGYLGTSYSRVLYNVVRGTDWNAGDAHANALKAVFGTTGWICKNTTAQADLKSYGFSSFGLCGTISHN